MPIELLKSERNDATSYFFAVEQDNEHFPIVHNRPVLLFLILEYGDSIMELDQLDYL